MTNRIPTPQLARRGFLRKAGILGMSLPVLGGAMAAACSNDDPPAVSANDDTANNDHADHNGNGDEQAVQDTRPGYQQMDDHHREGIELFLENQQNPITAGKGNLPLEYRMEDGVKVFDLTVDEVEWEVTPGQVEQARGYNRMLPGPVIRVTEGDQVRINVTNNLDDESTSVHWHGLVLPNAMDGVPFMTQDPIIPGETFAYEFTIRNSGTHMYHSHHNSLDQVNRGLLGAFIVDPADPATYPEYDQEYIMVLNDVALGFTINGKGFPATEAIYAKKGDRLLIRYMNEGLMHHPMHLHGMPMELIAKDGYPINPPQMCDTIDIAPGNRYDAIVECTEPGIWAFHCHVLSHAESAMGMFGMVTALIVEE